ncbi:unnamed protein product [Acanthoscelides obtectus]|uniref:Voltage-dependent L-type calcium channel IQ-associated domain-containing protein n=2 Tax=Acanthoscelides obtectus TaxID=200917 RepID=A0A9P0KMZ8_ACAOB|nr:unnamed protein product [Acanthoscelides obtectus]CAK1656503.1 Sodium channel protein 60E [Acanthoscelides obtectus]
MIVINMYIAIILENFNQAHQEEEIGIVEDDLEMFYIRWSKYDPHATQFIQFSQLSDFIASLDPPLGISKPNTVALVSFNLPIAKGDKIHCLDILHALVKHVLGHVEETDNFRQLQEQMSLKFKKQFPTRKELEIVSSTRIWKRQDKAARLIQKAFKDYVKRKKDKEREALEVDDATQTSSPGGGGGGWSARLSTFLHVHRGSRASSRKSSRASDASDVSELTGPWMNLPLVLLQGATPQAAAALGGTVVPPPLQQGDAGEDLEAGRGYRGAGADASASDTKHRLTLKVCEATPETGTTPVTPLPTPSGGPASGQRRRSFYNFPFFLRHQDAVVETEDGSSATTGTKKDASTGASLHPSSAEEKTKRIGSIIRRKRVGSVKARPTSVSQGSGATVQRTQSERCSGSGPPPDINILVTEASPESAGTFGGTGTTTVSRPPLSRQNTEAQVVQVLVHRESEEYNEEEELEHELGEQRLRAISPMNDTIPIHTVHHRDQDRGKTDS